MPFKPFYKRENLELAWRRITTARNYQYKRFYRELFLTYEIGLKKNLDHLHERLKGDSFIPNSCRKVFIPKPSGLQRGLSFLDIEDQIVYQAFANVFANKMHNRRKKLELSSVFSNVLNKETNNIFFFKDWHLTYNKFTKKIHHLYGRNLSIIFAQDCVLI
jgi:hypothetical protein